jgi:phenylacetate-CoA ligase
MHTDNLHIYGTADIGTMAWETPTSIVMKRTALKTDGLFEKMFGGIKKCPTFAQYNPREHMFEEQEGELLVTGNNAIPLIRYALGDNGGIMTYDDAARKMKESGIDLKKEATRVGVKQLCELPLVYVYERNDLSATLYGLQIYPETVREALLKDCLTPHVTGKFSMTTAFDKEQNQYLEINVELKKGVISMENGKYICKGGEEDLAEVVTKEIAEFLKDKNSEFRHLSAHLGERAIPKIVLWPTEHPTHFKPGGKQKWIKQ